MDADAMIKAIVDKHEAVYKGDSLYKNSIARVAAIDLSKVNESDVRNIVQRFLYEWGRMGRVLGQGKYFGWQGEVAEIIRTNSEILKKYQQRAIENGNLHNCREEIIRLYEAFQSKTGSIASAKILNLICPGFFPLWDNAIADAVRSELFEVMGYNFDKNIDAFSGRDYFRFVDGVKLFITRHYDIISSLSRQYQQNKLRIVDECFWWVVRRPFYLIF